MDEEPIDDCFATPGCLWSNCGPGPRAKELPEAPFATPGCHREASRRGCRAEVRPKHRQETGLTPVPDSCRRHWLPKRHWTRTRLECPGGAEVADSCRRHWLPKREGAHEVGRTACGCLPPQRRGHSNRVLAQRPCPQVLQRHPGVAKGTSINPLARGSSTEPLLG